MSASVELEVTQPLVDQPVAPALGTGAKVVFFGIFGIQNLGNECTLQSILQNAQLRLAWRGNERRQLQYG